MPIKCSTHISTCVAHVQHHLEICQLHAVKESANEDFKNLRIQPERKMPIFVDVVGVRRVRPIAKSYL